MKSLMLRLKRIEFLVESQNYITHKNKVHVQVLSLNKITNLLLNLMRDDPIAPLSCQVLFSLLVLFLPNIVLFLIRSIVVTKHQS